MDGPVSGDDRLEGVEDIGGGSPRGEEGNDCVEGVGTENEVVGLWG